MKRSQVILLIIVGGLSLWLGLWLSRDKAPAPIPENISSTLLPQGRLLPEFHLVNQENQPFSRDDLVGKWSFLFFGYTHCPDVCPAALTTMQWAWQILGNNKTHQNIPRQMVFISVDPRRDTPEVMKSYVKYFDPSFIGLTGELPEIDALTRNLGILYAYTPEGKDGKNYSVSHSGQILLIDPKANLRAVFSPPHEVDKIVGNFISIVDYVKE